MRLCEILAQERWTQSKCMHDLQYSIFTTHILRERRERENREGAREEERGGEHRRKIERARATQGRRAQEDVCLGMYVGLYR